MERRGDRAGFSLIEALVVLAVGGMALSIIFSIGMKAGEAGFYLGRRALAVADQEIAAADARTLIRSIALRPPELYDKTIDRPVIGAPDRLEADIVAQRATQCVPLGWAGRMILLIETKGRERHLVCEAGDERVVLLASTDPGARLTYSTDGVAWSDAYRLEGKTAGDDDMIPSTRLYVRFRGGAFDLIDVTTSGQPESWIRRDEPF